MLTHKVKKIVAILGLGLITGLVFIPTVFAIDPPTSTPLIAPLPSGPTVVPLDDLNGYVNAIFTYGIGLAALLAMAQLVFGAVQYTTSAGAPSLQEDAKSRMRGAIIGLILLILSVTILATLSGGDSFSLSKAETILAEYNLQKYDEMSDEDFCKEIEQLRTRKNFSNTSINTAMGNIQIQEKKITNEIEPDYKEALENYTAKKAEYEGCVDLNANNPGVEGGDGSGEPGYCKDASGKTLPGGLSYSRARVAWGEKILAQPNVSDFDKGVAERAIESGQINVKSGEEGLAYLEDGFASTKSNYEEQLARAKGVIEQSTAIVIANAAKDSETEKLLNDLDSKIRARCK